VTQHVLQEDTAVDLLAFGRFVSFITCHGSQQTDAKSSDVDMDMDMDMLLMSH
jgi:hypothetical protein